MTVLHGRCQARGVTRDAGAQRKGRATLLEIQDGFSEEVTFPFDVNCKALTQLLSYYYNFISLTTLPYGYKDGKSLKNL